MTSLIGVFKKSKNQPELGDLPDAGREARVQCPQCRAFETEKRLAKNRGVCPRCGRHFRMSARDRVAATADKNSFRALFAGLESVDFLAFPGYADKLAAAKENSGEGEAVLCGAAKIGGAETALFVMESGFMMGSMGSVVGEKLARLFEHALTNGLPVVGFAASGGARMQEGLTSLMQMAKVSGAVRRHGAAGNLYISVLTDPTTGGVTASFAMLGDIILAEPGATVGFAGKRVVQQTTKESLPEDFQTAESMLAHGFIDAVIPRDKMRETLARLLGQHTRSL